MAETEARVAAFAARCGMLSDGETVLCALSGGADSVCLLALLRELGIKVTAAHYNHMLRGAEADADEEFCRALCKRLDVPFTAGRGDVAAFAKSERLGTEEAARRLRYAFLESAADGFGAAKIATAHNADDNAETLLMNLMRGAGTRGLGGIPPVRGRLIRPLLTLSRAEIEAYLAEKGMSYVTDSTNLTDDYTRNRVRHAVIPALRELCPDFESKAASAAAFCREDDECLSAMAKKLLSGSVADVEQLKAAPPAVRKRALRLLAESCGACADSVKTAAMQALLYNPSPSASADIGGGVRISRRYGELIAQKTDGAATFEPFALESGASKSIPEAGFTVCRGRGAAQKQTKTQMYFDPEKISGAITIRPRTTGDSVRLSEKAREKSLKKLFIEKKTPLARRALIPVVADENGVLGVCGFGADARAAAKPDGEAEYIIFEVTEADI